MNIRKIFRVVFRFLIILIGLILGYLLSNAFLESDLIFVENRVLNFGIKILTSLIFALIFYFISGRLEELLKLLIKEIESELYEVPLSEIVLAAIGLMFGLLIAFLISQIVLSFKLGFFGSVISLLIYIIFGYLGLSLSVKNKDSILNIFKENQFSVRNRDKDEKNDLVINLDKSAKVLDTSAIIDGRILEIAKSDFLEGPLILPVFVLEELQHIADSSDSLKRNRGRRGLEVINAIQELQTIEVIIVDRKYEEISEVDSKLVRLALDENAKIITNDFNLNKVAEVQGIKVLNINELANALKPVAIPGETMYVQIIKEGQEQNQGVAYLDDGTMIVVENGKKHIGESKEVLVTSVLQTNAGKMIFAKIK